MEIITINAISQIIGTLAVVLSLIYLAIQVRQGTKNLRTTTRDSSFRSLMEWNYYIMSDPDLAWIFQQGCKDFESLNEKDRARYVHVMYSFLKMFENLYLHYSDKSIEIDVWEHNRHILEAYAYQPGAKYYWSQRSGIFHPDFQKFFNEIHSSTIPAGHIVTQKTNIKDGES